MMSSAAKARGWLAAVAPAVAAALLVPAATAAAASAPTAAPLVTISPLRGTLDASPTTQISFLGVPAADISRIVVRGSRSGGHAGKFASYSTGTGGSFLPLRAFTAGEQVSVSAVETYHGVRRAIGTSFAIGSLYVLPPPTPKKGATGATGATGAVGATGSTGAAGYVSLPSIHPPKVSVTTPAADPALGDIFMTPVDGGIQPGSMIINPSGQMVWFSPAPTGMQDADLRVQSYLGHPVLTYWQGRIAAGHGVDGIGVINSTSYQKVAEVRAGNGLTMDLHEFDLEPNGVALITAFEPVTVNLHAYGGQTQGIIEDCVIQQIDVRTGLVMFEWHAYGHIPLNASYSKVPNYKGGIWDWFHINSIDVEPNGNMLISSRNTWAVYQIGHTYGEVLWRLGGRNSSFTLGPGVRFAYQHDATLVSANRIEVFDNEDTPAIAKASRALVIALNFSTFSASLLRAYIDPGQTVLSPSQGNIQQLGNSDAFVGWGQIGIASEFSLRGSLTFQLSLPPLVESYRAYRFSWSAQPTGPPTLVATRAAGAASASLAMSWNGATGVTGWQVLAGSAPSALAPLGTPVPSAGFETLASAATSAPYVAVQALGTGGKVLATSAPVTPAP